MEFEKVNIETPEHVSLSFRTAGLGSRAAAFLIDGMIIGLIMIILSITLMVLNEFFFMIFLGNENIAIALLIISFFIVIWGYFVLFEFFTAGRTPGKKLVGIRVVQDNGQSITFLSALIRNLFRIVDSLPAFYMLGILMIFFHSRHKRLGDIIAGTIVVYQQKNQRSKKKKDQLKRELEQSIESKRITIDDWSKNKLKTREWQLLKTYIERRNTLSSQDRFKMTKEVAGILLPIAGINLTHKSVKELEEDLFALYALLKEDWEYKE